MKGTIPVGGTTHQGTGPPAPVVAEQDGHILLVQFKVKDLEVLSNAFGDHNQVPLHGESDQHLGSGFDPGILQFGRVFRLGPRACQES